MSCVWSGGGDEWCVLEYSSLERERVRRVEKRKGKSHIATASHHICRLNCIKKYLILVLKQSVCVVLCVCWVIAMPHDVQCTNRMVNCGLWAGRGGGPRLFTSLLQHIVCSPLGVPHEDGVFMLLGCVFSATRLLLVMMFAWRLV